MRQHGPYGTYYTDNDQTWKYRYTNTGIHDRCLCQDYDLHNHHACSPYIFRDHHHETWVCSEHRTEHK